MLDELQKDYQERGQLIQARLKEFRAIRDAGDEAAVFKELCFCILAANSSAEMGLRSLEAIDDILLHGSLEALQSRLSRGFRYWRIRPAYIIHTREYLRSRHDFGLLKALRSLPGHHVRRDFLALDKNIKGIGLKEASHFLRNIGFKGYAILDKHILRSLAEFGVIGLPRKPLNRPRYLRVEGKMARFSEETGIGMDALDLLLWSRKTGKIIK
ncbi:MAG TPA: N-glycosylase/DNA lyase [Nitrospiria bacterium]